MDKIVDPLVCYMYFREPLEIKSYADFIARIHCEMLPEKSIMETIYFCDFCMNCKECIRMRELQNSLVREYERIKESE